MAKQYFGLDLIEVVKLTNKMKGMGKEDLKSIIDPSVMEGAKTMAREIRRLAPHGTGQLKRNISTDSLSIRKKGQSGSCVYFKADAYYWRFVEMGTIRQKPQPFVRTAYQLNKKRVGNAIMRDVYDRVSKKWQTKT